MEFRKTLFWDTDPKKIDIKKNAQYIIERILDFGRDDEVKWLWRNYSQRQIYDTVTNRRGIDKRTRALWTILTAPGK